MTDGINAGLASDRLEAYWRLDETRKLVEDLSQTPVFLVASDAAGEIQATLPPHMNDDLYAVEIPYEVGKLKQTHLEKAKAWQICVRQAMTTLLATGFIVSGFTRENGRCWYLLSRLK
jgi:predicted GNAT superfamily acetyltransferase